MQGVHSLRALERLARLDVGCMWVCGGIAPDHANIGRFITLHEASLTHDFFESAKAAREALAQAPADPNAQQAEREARECSMMR
ncbi:transposase [Advenella faeciporci]|uniref:transposase n=1 Tax=Advenella faeciporci TaxID=797535 RepID=UPI003CD05381